MTAEQDLQKALAEKLESSRAFILVIVEDDNRINVVPKFGPASTLELVGALDLAKGAIVKEFGRN